jgi:hypothetical protein
MKKGKELTVGKVKVAEPDKDAPAAAAVSQLKDVIACRLSGLPNLHAVVGRIKIYAPFLAPEKYFVQSKTSPAPMLYLVYFISAGEML